MKNITGWLRSFAGKALLAVFAFCALLGGGAFAAAGQDPGKTLVTATIFPFYDWVRVLSRGAEGVETALLCDNGADLHSYQPSAADIMKIAGSGLLIYGGGESDAWVRKALASAGAADRGLALLHALGDAAKAEETPEGAQTGHGHEAGSHPHAGGTEYDEHIWLSLKNAEILIPVIRDALCAVSPANADLFARNAAAYLEELRDLDSRYAETVAAAPKRVLLVADRFPFRYLADDYGLRCFAAFSGCSAESEAGFDTVIALADAVKSNDLRAAVQLESSDGSLARAVSRAAGRELAVVVLDSMQSVGKAGIRNGVSYVSVMRADLAALAEALK